MARLETAHGPSPPHLSTELSRVVLLNFSGRGIGDSRGFSPLSGSKYRHCGLAQLADGIASHAIDYYIIILRKCESSVAFWCPFSSVPYTGFFHIDVLEQAYEGTGRNTAHRQGVGLKLAHVRTVSYVVYSFGKWTYSVEGMPLCVVLWGIADYSLSCASC
jgi:hypothetical protein